jgi:hypothetical protein
MAFGAPLARYVNDDGRDVEIVAASWGPLGRPGRGLGARRDLADLLEPTRPCPAPRRGHRRGRRPGRSRPAGAPLPPFLPDNEAGWPFGDLPADEAQQTPFPGQSQVQQAR